MTEVSTDLPSPSATGMAAAEAQLWHAWRLDADSAARAQLLEIHLPYARVVAASYFARRTHNDVEFEEYRQLATVGLLESLERFDAQRGVQFRTYAARRMHGAILDGLERCTEKNQQIAVGKRLRQEQLEAAKSIASDSASKRSKQDVLLAYLADVGLGLALGVLLEGTGMVDAESYGSTEVVPSPEVSYFRKTELQRLQELVREQVRRLTTQEQAVIRYHYLQEFPFESIADELGVTRGRISQIHKSALTKLRAAFSHPSNCDISL